MKKRNRLFSLLLALAMVLTYMPALAFAEPDNGGEGDKALTLPALPAYIIEGNEGLSFTVAKPQGADKLKVEVWFDLEGNEGEDTLFCEETLDTQPIEVDINADRLQKDMIVTVKAEARGDGYVYEERHIPVIAEPSDVVSITSSKTSVPVNEDISVKVNASGNKEIKKVRFFNGDDFWGEDDPDDDGSYRRDISFGEAGAYVLFAKVKLNDSNEWLTCEPVTVTATAEGRVGDFTITGITEGKDKTEFDGTVTRGDVLNIECGQAENADHYWIDVDKKNGEKWDWYDHYADSDSNSIRFNTVGLEPGVYKVSVGADAVGYESSHSDEFDLTVTDMILSDGVYFEVSKTELDTGETFEFAAYCPGASWIKVFMNYGEDKNWSRDTHGWDDGNVFIENDSYGNSGTYKLRAEAYDTTNAKIAESQIVEMTVTAPEGDLELTAPEFPAYLTGGKDDLSFTFERPEHADHIKARVWFDKEGYEGDNNLFEDETDDDSLDVSVDKDKLQKDIMVRVALEAWGRGYNGVYREFRIPVVGDMSDEVSIQANKTKVTSNEGIIFTVSAGDQEIDKVRFFDGWNLGGAEDPDREDHTRYTRYHGFDKAGTYNIFAKVKIKDADDWVTTEPITITVTSKGRVGEFTVTEINGEAAGDSFSIKRGKIAALKYTKSENAERYWIDVLTWNSDWNDWEWFDSFGHTDQLSASLGTAIFEPGKYRIIVKASGLGYESYETAPIGMTVTESDITGNEMSLEVSKTEALTNEDIVFSAYCPNAKAIEYYIDDGEGSDEWKDHCDGNSCTDAISFDRKGEYDLVVTALNDDGQTIATERKILNFTAPYGKLQMDVPELPDTICRDVFSFTVNMPENGYSIFVIIWDRGKEESEENVIAADRTGDDTLKMTVPASKLAGVSKLGVRVIGYGVGYEYADENYYDEANGITVANHDLKKHEAKQEGCTEAGNTAYWNCDRCGKYYSDKEGSTEIEENSWVVPASGHEWGEWRESTPSTCIKKGQMERICKKNSGHKEYKDAELSSHRLTKTNAVAATYDKTGNIEYWTCSECGKIFKDASGTREITKADTITARLTPKQGDSVTLSSGKYKVTGGSSVSFTGAPNRSSITVPDSVNIGGKVYAVTSLEANAFSKNKATTAVIGKNVKTIKANAFKGSKIKTLTVKSKKLTKKSVKNSLKGSKVKTIKVKVGSKKQNKTYVKKYKKIFTKKNAGKKVSVK